MTSDKPKSPIEVGRRKSAVAANALPAQSKLLASVGVVIGFWKRVTVDGAPKGEENEVRGSGRGKGTPGQGTGPTGWRAERGGFLVTGALPRRRYGLNGFFRVVGVPPLPA